MKTNFSLLFYLKKSKNYQCGPLAIYMRITVDGKRSEISTGRSCEPRKWLVGAGRVSGKNEDAKSLNAYLTDLQKLIHLVIKNISKEWTMPIHNWGLSFSQLYIKFGDRILQENRGF